MRRRGILCWLGLHAWIEHRTVRAVSGFLVGNPVHRCCRRCGAGCDVFSASPLR